MTSKALVGPLPTITFSGGPGGYWAVTRQAYEVPRNTLDPRFTTCQAHHPACDCREAELAEQRHEMRAEVDAWYRAARTVLAGHRTFDWPSPGADLDGRGPLACQCSGCQLVRAVSASLFLLGGDYDTGQIGVEDVPGEAPQ